MIQSTNSTNGKLISISAPETVRLTVIRKRSQSTIEAGTTEHSHAELTNSKMNHHVAGSWSSTPAQTVPLTPVQFSFATEKLGTGLRSLTGVIAGVGVGAFLATHISTTPPLHLKVAFVAGVSCLLGLCLVPSALRGLFGKLRVDSRGLRMTPALVGFNIDWKDLEQWSVEGIHLHLRSRRTKHTYIFDLDNLNLLDRSLLRSLLIACVPEIDRRAIAKEAE